MNATLEHEKISEATLQTAIVALLPHGRIRLLTTLLEQLAPAEQVQVVMHVLPGIAPTINATAMNPAARTTKDAPIADAIALIDLWRTDPILDEAESSWQEIMENLETHGSRG